MDEFLRLYGTRTLGLMIARFIREAPEFEGDKELAAEIGTAIAVLESDLNKLIQK